MRKVIFLLIFLFSLVSTALAFQTELIRVENSSSDNKVLILVDESIFSQIEGELNTYLDALATSGWGYECWKVESEEEIEEIRELRRFIIQRWEASGVGIFGVFGVFFIDGGELPLVHVSGFFIPVPTELYWMDISPENWNLWEFNGMIWADYKKWRNLLLEIFVSRIRGEAEDLRGYLRKIVDYRGCEEYEEEGLFYCLKEGKEESLELFEFLVEEIETIECASCGKECFLRSLKKSKKWINLEGTTGTNTGEDIILPSGEEVSVEEIKNSSPEGRFYILSGNSINYDVSNYVGSGYLFSGRGIGIFGWVDMIPVSNAELARPAFYRYLKKGLPIGEVQQRYVVELAGLEQGSYCSAAYGYILAGDPTIITSSPPPVRALVKAWVYKEKLHLKVEVENTTRNPMKVKTYLLVRIPCHPLCGFLTFFFNGKEWTTEPVSVPIEISPGEKKILEQSVSISNLQIDHDPHDIWEFGIFLLNPFIEAVLDWDIFYICPFDEIPQ